MRQRRAYHVYLILSGTSALFYGMVFTVNLVYQATVVGLNPLQMILVGTLLETVAFLCEVPTGIVADLYSRRLSVIIGFFLIGAGFALEGAVPRFEAVLATQVLWGVGFTFTSGATEAWIADEVGAERASRAFLRAAQLGQVGGLIGIVASVALASVSLNLPILLGGLLFIGLAVTLLLIMPEHGFKPVPRDDRSTWGAMRQTLTDGIGLARRRHVLRVVLGVSLFVGLASEAYDRLWQVHLLESFVFPELGRFQPVVWFGVISMVGMILSLGTTELVKRRGLDAAGQLMAARVLLLLTALKVGGVIGFALAGSFALALAAFWLVTAVSVASDPVTTAWLNRNLEPGVRATVISMNGQVNALGQIGGGPMLGAVATAGSVRSALVASGLTLSPAVLLFGWAARRRAAQPASADESAEAVGVDS